jgi:hypothetical protein
MREKWKKMVRKAFMISFWLSWVISDPELDNFIYFIVAFLIALIPSSSISLIKNRGSIIRLLFKIPVYAFYLSIVPLAVTFIATLINICTFSGVVPFVFALIAMWALIMLLMLLWDRILGRRGN